MIRALLSALFVLLLAGPAHADESRPAFLGVQQSGVDTYDLLWKVPAKGPDQRLGLYVRLPDDVRELAPKTISYIGGAFVERWAVRRPGGLAGATITIDGLSRTVTDVLVRVEHLEGPTQITRLASNEPSFVVDAVPGSVEVAKTYLGLGVKHILSGIDHLLFVACLMMVAGIGRRLVITITGFTIAHSLTLALSALQWVRLPVPPMEAVIALSIVFVASEIARGARNTLTYRYPVVVSSSFGLLHGFGFATVLAEIGLPQADVVTGLLFFNIGVEVGQLLFVGAVMLALWTYRTTAASRGAFRLARLELPAAYAIGSVASFWLISRTAFLWA